MSNCGALKKENLAESLLNLIKTCDVIPRSSIELSRGPDPVPNEIYENLRSEIEHSFQKHVQDLGNSNEFVFNTIHDQIKNLETLTSEILQVTSRSGSAISSNSSQPPTQMPVSLPNVSNFDVSPCIDLIPEFIPGDFCDELYNYCQSADSELSSVNHRHVLYFGESDYTYTGKVHKAREAPETIRKVMDMINSKYPTKVINSCLITKYSDGTDFCPPHSDNEDEISPESHIYTLSVGACRKMAFHPMNSNGVETEKELPAGSLLIFSRQSQESWKHSIPVSTGTSAVRYSFTFRLVGPHFINSTLICGDSNTIKMKFGTDRGTFGEWMPGRHIPTYHISDIPDPLEIGPYKNIVLHVGVNDIRTNYEGQTTIMKNIETLESKCKMLLTAYPKSKIFLCPILPTKDSGKKHRVNLMNGGITGIAHKYTNIVLMENYYSLFTCEDGTLNPRLGRFYQGVPNERDEVHLGNSGIRLLARCIKHCVLKRKGSVLSFGQGPSRETSRDRSEGVLGGHSFDGQYRAALMRGPSHGVHHG